MISRVSNMASSADGADLVEQREAGGTDLEWHCIHVSANRQHDTVEA